MSKTDAALWAIIAATLAFAFGAALGWERARRYYEAREMSRPAPVILRLEDVEEIEAERVRR